MRRAHLRVWLLAACWTTVGSAQPAAPPVSADLARIFTFETDHPGGVPRGWGGGPPDTVVADGEVVHSGRWSGRLERTAASPGPFSSLTLSLPMEFAGRNVEWRGYLRTEDVNGMAALWLRQDGESGRVAFDNMAGRQLKGTSGWTQYSVTLPVHPDGRTLVFGVLLSGTGKAWADDFELLVDGKPIWEAPASTRAKTIVELDREFDSGSRISVAALTPEQIQNLVTLAKVWGFVKYHHPAITGGRNHWDYELFRVMPKVIAAADRASANSAMDAWLARLGPVPDCSPCATLDEATLHLEPALEWIDDTLRLGAGLSSRLRAIHRNRHAAGPQFYVSLNKGVGNPSFDHELAYQSMPVPDSGFQLLALFRFWNIIEYWFPYKNVIGEPWEGVLARFVPRIALAKDRLAFQLEMMALVATANDTHANLWSSLDVRPPRGTCRVPVHVRFVEGVPVVAGYADAAAGPAAGLALGDVLLELDGTPLSTLVERWRPYYAASNEPTRLRDMGRALTNGPCGEATLLVRRGDRTVPVTTSRVPLAANQPLAVLEHDLPGDTFRLLSADVAYLKLSSVRAADTASYVERASGTNGLIIDIRNYPSEFVVFMLGSLLVESVTPFVTFSAPDLANPGAFRWGTTLSLSPGKPRYAGKVVILVDEITLSQAEYTTMAFRTAPGALVVGSTTSGADGNVSPIPLPGGLRAMISGIGVFYPDKRPTQRVGIIPDVEVRPTIAGIRAGRDEVLEEGLRRILGPGTSQAELEAIVSKARAAAPAR